MSGKIEASIWDNFNHDIEDDDDDLPPLISKDHVHDEASCSHSHELETIAYGLNPLLWLPIAGWNTFVTVYNGGRNMYRQYWVPFLFAFGKYAFGGREHAGRVSKRSKIIRITAMAVSLVSLYFLVDLMTFSEFKASGAETPLWSANGLTTTVFLSWMSFAAMSINMLAVFVGSAANHNKIQQYMEMREQVAKITGNAVACGAHDTPSMRRMNYARYAHDMNGAIGTALSAVVFVSFGLGMLGLNMGIGAHTLFIMFVARTVSFVLSVTLAPVTGVYRLNEYKKDLTGKMETHMDKKEKSKKAIDDIFSGVEMTNEIKLFKFSCFRACEKHFGNEQWDKQKAITAVNAAITHYIQHGQINKETINATVGMRIPFIDALNFIQLEVEAALAGKNDMSFIPQDNPQQYGSSARLLFGALKLHQDNTALVSKCKKDEMTHLYEVDTAAVVQKEKISTHGIDARAAMVMEGNIVPERSRARAS